MYQHDFSKVTEMNISSNVVFANQADRTEYKEEVINGFTAKMITTSTRGVGINRNLALMYASGDVCLMADDDVVYCDDVESQVIAEFEAHPDADVIVFNFNSTDENRPLNKYSRTRKHGRYSRTPWGAIRIAFKKAAVDKANAWFTTLFGGGCRFPSGEDSMWIKSLKKSGLTFYVSDKTIGTVSFDESTWFTGYNEKYYYGVGAYYASANPRIYKLKFWYTILRTRSLKELSVKQKMKWLKNGRRGYKAMLSYNDFVAKYDIT